VSPYLSLLSLRASVAGVLPSAVCDKVWAKNREFHYQKL
jgi:hypothetical protein